MTPLHRPVKREIVIAYKGYGPKQYIAEFGAHGVTLREKGRRTGYPVPWSSVLDAGVRAVAMEAARERAARRRR